MDPFLHSFRSIRQSAKRACLDLLAKTDDVRDLADSEVEAFQDAVEDVISTGHFQRLDGLLERWSQSLPENSALPADQSLTSLVQHLLQGHWTIIAAALPAPEASRLYLALLPVVNRLTERLVPIEVQRSTAAIKAALQETQSDLEIIERNKSKFIRIAAHELKTPLTIINGYIAMMAELLTEDQGQLRNMLNGIESGADRLRSIVQDLIDVSLIDNRLLNFSMQPVWLDRLFEALFWEITPILQTRSLAYTVQPFEGMDEMIYSDSERLLQVFRNLVSNAIKYTPDGGSITVHGRKLPGFIEVIVTDTGVGIAPEYQTLVFEKFIQLGEDTRHSSSKTRYRGGGPGLGLHITKGVIEAMGGAVWVESTGFDEVRCPGSSFHVLLPINQKSSQDNVQEFLHR